MAKILYVTEIKDKLRLKLLSTFYLLIARDKRLPKLIYFEFILKFVSGVCDVPRYQWARLEIKD